MMPFADEKAGQPAGPCARLFLRRRAPAGLPTEVPPPGRHHCGGHCDHYLDGDGLYNGVDVGARW